MKKLFLLLIVFASFVAPVAAQRISLADSISTLNKLRIKTNTRGMHVLGGWGAVNFVVGGIGYFAAKDKEVKYFQGMNAIWGITNAGIGAMGLMGVRKEMNATLSCSQAYDRYENNKQLYLINAGLDFLYIGTGVFLEEHSNTVKHNPEVWSGFGKSVALQGIFLLIFDNVMYASHQHRNSKWISLLNGLCVSGNGVGFNYRF